MSRVDDSDNQRIREMQEQELKARKDGEKKDADMRITKSFQEVMRERFEVVIQHATGRAVIGFMLSLIHI